MPVASVESKSTGVDTVIHDIGAAAGAVWETLARNGPVSLDWLCRATGLAASEANRGIGWLAREGKLSVERRGRRREVRVAKAAEQVRQLLRCRGPMQLVRATRMTTYPEDLAQQGLGWLARDGLVTLRKAGDGQQVEIGRAAGVIWRLVQSCGTVARWDVAKATNLPAALVNEAIGWLVREGKLVVEDRSAERPAAPGPAVKGPAPTSGGTLTLEKGGRGREVRVGEVAGVIWEALHRQGALDKEELGRVTLLAENLLDQGIGWLAREDKLAIFRNRKGHERFRLSGG